MLPVMGGCSTPEELITNQDLRIGMTINQFEEKMFWGVAVGDDPWQSGGSGYDNKFQNHTLVYGENRNKIFIFDSEDKLLGWHDDFPSAQAHIDANNLGGLKTAQVAAVTQPTIMTAQSKDTIPPIINIASTVLVENDSPVVSGTVSDNYKVVQVTVNGVSADLSNNIFSFTRYVPATGSQVTIEAIDEWGNKSTKLVTITREITQTAAIRFDPLDPTTFSARSNPDAVALIIGIANYKRTAEAKYADRDADYFADYARRKLGVPSSNIKVLTNASADINDIIEATNVWLPSVVKAGASDVYVFFAGHGLGSDDGNDIYLLPYNGIPQVLERTALQRTEFFDTIASTQPRSATVFLDTCYSGTSRTEEVLLASRGITITPKTQSIPVDFTVFSAAGMKQTAKMLDEAEHGLFSYWLMKGMEGDADGNKDRQITAGELQEYVLANVSRLQRNQTPELMGDAERVLVAW